MDDAPGVQVVHALADLLANVQHGLRLELHPWLHHMDVPVQWRALAPLGDNGQLRLFDHAEEVQHVAMAGLLQHGDLIFECQQQLGARVADVQLLHRNSAWGRGDICVYVCE